jgi:serine/threonine-protein kinase
MTVERKADNELELAASVSDRAGNESEAETARSASLPSENVPTLEGGYRRALADIEWLVERRRRVAQLDDNEPDERRETRGGGGGEAGTERWGPFELVTSLGAGASGEVYKGRDHLLGHYVALKLFHRTRLDSEDQEAILVEGRRHALVKHANIAALYGADEYDGKVGIWMEYIDGSTLQEIVERQGPFGAAEALPIGISLCSAVAAVHRQGLTHGDIKAQNVMREKGGRIVLMDFSSSRSVSKLEELGGPVGTPLYMAPEMFEGSPPSFEGDVYSLGVLLFYLVTGRHPTEARTLRELKDSLREGKALHLNDLRPDLPHFFVEAVHRAIATRPADRFSSVGRFQSALAAGLNEVPTNDPLPGSGKAEPAGIAELQRLARAASHLTGLGAAIAVLALLGILNEGLFNLVFHVPEKFTSYSAPAAVVVGFRSTVVTLTLFVLNLLAVMGLWALGRSIPIVRSLGRRFTAAVESLAPASLAAAFGFAAIGSVGAACYYFRDLLSLIIDMVEERGVIQDAGLLCPSPHQDLFSLAFAEIAILLTVGFVAIFRLGPRRAERDPTFRLMKWISAAGIVTAVAITAAPWKLLTKSEVEWFSLQDRKHFIVAAKDDEVFVYVPGAPPDEQHRSLNRRDVPSGERGVQNAFCSEP